MECCQEPEFEVVLPGREPLIFDDRVQVGSHVPFQNKRFYDSVLWGIRYGMYTMQLYMGPQQAYARTRISEDDILQTQQLLKHHPSNLFTHAPVIYNLAGNVKEKSLAWTGNALVDDKMVNLVKYLNYEIGILNRIGGRGTIVHPGCYIRDPKKPQAQIEEEAIVAIAKTLDLLVFEGSAKILLENSAGEKGKVAYNLEQLARIREKSRNKKHVAFCLDTAHLWGGGVYRLNTLDGVEKMFQDIDKYRADQRGNVELIHLNDSEVNFDSRVDRHACLCTGYIWKDDVTPLVYLLNLAGERGIPLVMETSVRDMGVIHHLLNMK